MSLRSLAQAFLESQKAQVSQRDIPGGVPVGQMVVNEVKIDIYGVPASVPGGTVANKHRTNGTSVPVETVRDAGTSGTFGTVGTSGTKSLTALQRDADRRNDQARRDGRTDRYCRCGKLSMLAWPLEGRREMWRCLECYPTQGYN